MTDAPLPSVLIADADVASRRANARALSQTASVWTVEDADSATSVLEAHAIDVVVVALPELTELVAQLAARGDLVVVGVGPAHAAAVALDAGAASFVAQPQADGSWIRAAVISAAAAAVRLRSRRESESSFLEELAQGELVATSGAMRTVTRLLARSASIEAPVLVIGEPGSGVTTVARRVHAEGTRAARPLIEVAGAAFGEGTEPGALATTLHDARGATLIVDGVNELGAAATVELAAWLAARVKGVGARSGAARLVATAPPSIRDDARTGAFRRDVLSGLAGVLIEVPPLARRGDDIPVLAQLLLRRAARRLGRDDVKRLGTSTLRALRAHAFPGHARELAEVLERAVLEVRGDVVLPSHLGLGTDSAAAGRRELGALRDALTPDLLELPHAAAKERVTAAFDAAYADALLRRAGGNASQAARAAGMDRSNFKRLLRRSASWTGRSTSSSTSTPPPPRDSAAETAAPAPNRDESA